MTDNPYSPPPPGSEDPFVVQTPYQPAPGQVHEKWHRGRTVLTWGIVSLVACGPLGIVAWVMGSRDLREMEQGIMDPSGRGATRAGKVMGIFGSTLGTLIQVLYVWAQFAGATL